MLLYLVLEIVFGAICETMYANSSSSIAVVKLFDIHIVKLNEFFWPFCALLFDS